MHVQKRWLLVINIPGGLAVLGSYAWGLGTHPGAGTALWGGMPQVWRQISTANMLLAALGYFAFTSFILFNLDPGNTVVFGRPGYGLFHLLYAVILLPSALWMPLTTAVLASPGQLLLWSVRLLLALIGLASLAMLLTLWSLRPPRPTGAWRLAVIGCAFFCLQTVVLDAAVWSAYFSP